MWLYGLIRSGTTPSDAVDNRENSRWARPYRQRQGHEQDCHYNETSPCSCCTIVNVSENRRSVDISSCQSQQWIGVGVRSNAARCWITPADHSVCLDRHCLSVDILVHCSKTDSVLPTGVRPTVDQLVNLFCFLEHTWMREDLSQKIGLINRRNYRRNEIMQGTT